MDSRVFDYLKNAAKISFHKENLPTLYLLALTKYYAGMETVEPQER